MKLAIIDLDGVVADNTERMKRAESRKNWYEANLCDALAPELNNPANLAQLEKGLHDFLENLYWQVAFTSDYVPLDTLIEGVEEAMYHLEENEGYHIVFLTSRIESMRFATLAWLTEHLGESVQSYDLIMKTSAFQYTKTPVWKAGMVQTLVSLYGADDLLVVDDSPDVQKAVLDVYPDGGAFGIVFVVSSLIEATAIRKEKDNGINRDQEG